MSSILELINSRLPLFKFFEEKFKNKYGVEKFTGHWNETYYIYIFVMSLVHISLLLYTFYLLYTCLRVKRVQGSGTTYVNGFCDVLFACACMPCYIIYRGFINPCKVLKEVKVIKEYHSIPAQPTYQPAQLTYQPTQSTYQPAQPTYQPAQPAQPVIIGRTETTKVVGGSSKNKKGDKSNKKKSGKLNNVVTSNKVCL